MKRFFLLLLFFLISFSVFATERTEIAQQSAISQAKLTFAHLGNNLRLDITSVDEILNTVYVEVSIGTIRRPARIHTCFIASFENNGFDYISKLEQKWDEPCH
jgi:hypothetical protein